MDAGSKLARGVIKKALRQLHESRGVNSIGYLKEIIPIGESTEEFLEYISY
jgi:hypothetical protein